MDTDTPTRTLRPQIPSQRLLSIDALRGFDMFWIIGGEDVVKALSKWSGWRFDKEVHEQLAHVDWEGFHFYDLIFPLFIFVSGVVLPFSLESSREKPETRAKIYGRIIRRTVLLFVLGLVCNNVLQFDFSNLRVTGVLQRIAICYGAAALLTVHLRIVCQAALVAILLVGYWMVLLYVPVPGNHAGDYSKEGNLPGYVDRHFLPGKIMPAYYGFGDNEGLLSTIPAIATALIGALAGNFLRSRFSPGRKVFGLAVAGISLLLLGAFWAQYFPIVKNIWTSSFTLVAGGWSLLLLAVFYGLVDGLRLRRWAFFFVVIGANAIAIYVVPHFLDFEKIAHFFLGGLIRHAGKLQPVLGELSVLIVEWLFLLYLYQKRIFLRV